MLAALLVWSCQDEEINTPNGVNREEDCLTTRRANHGQIVEGQYIVAFSTDKNPGANSGARVKDMGVQVLERNQIALRNIKHTIEGETRAIVATLSKAELEKMQQDRDVLMIEPDRLVSICACFTLIESRSLTWNVDKVGYDNGIGKTAWIIDTGIDLDHPDLNVDVQRSRSFLPGQTSADDENGHGTHIAGIIGALNNRIGTLGVASGASLVALKVLNNQGEGLVSHILSALSYVRRNARAGDVVNLSLGADGDSQILEREIQAIAGMGIYFAIAAGNESKPAREYSPARIGGRNIYTVSAIDSLNRMAHFSNYGNDVVDFAAPGVRILSAYTNGRYARMSGTSMATPHVAGLLLINNGRINSSGFALNDPDGQPDPIARR